MGTDGLNAFDYETRQYVKRAQRLKLRRPYRLTKERKAAGQESPAHRAARAWMAHKLSGGAETAAMYATRYDTTERSVVSAAHRIRKKQTPPAL